MEAQTKTVSAAGEYYLQGVMEMASGFKLNDDSSFQFFFSYGALDREGSGRWSLDGNTVILNSTGKSPEDFTLIKSATVAEAPFSIRVTGLPPAFFSYVYAKLKSGENSKTVKADKNGIITFNTNHAESIELLFELCPEKKFVYKVENSAVNYLEFKMEASITNMRFENFRLECSPGELKGPHPLITEKSFVYKKANR